MGLQIETTNFSVMQSATAKHFKAMSANRLFSTGVDGTALWETYLNSFPEGSNPIYRKRTEHDCSCCRHFIKTIGGVVNILNGRVVTLWDFEVGGAYQQVADVMAEFVRGQVIRNVFLHPFVGVGNANTRQLLEDRTVKQWDHFHVNLPDSAVMRKDQIGTRLGEFTAAHDVMLRGLNEITVESVDMVLELIGQNSLYRGEEHKFAVEQFRKLKTQFFANALSARERDLFVWENVDQAGGRIRNTVIGTLLVDLSSGVELEDAVRSFETKVAPANYKRPTALVSKAMIAKAQATVNELGLATALERRYATLDDLTINNLLFANRDVKRAMRSANVFEEISASTSVDVKKLGKIEEIAIADFIHNVLPSAKSVDVLLESQHEGNLVSLVAPADPTAKRLFKWPNLFSWSYAGDLADSIKARVKRAGGNVTGDFRASLAWHNYDDLDLHLRLPGNGHIYFAQKVDYPTQGKLDVDMNAGSGTTRTPVENIVLPSREKMKAGIYEVLVNQFNKREPSDVGFEVEMEMDGVVCNFSYAKPIKHGETILVCKFHYTPKEGLVILESLPPTQTSKKVWNLSTQTFHQVRAVMLSPNHWDGREIGNKHYFFMLDGCRNEGTARGFYNEFLHESLTPHRKVLEMVGARMKTEAGTEVENQLSGVGFSSTQRNHLFCRVTGAFSRTVKVLF